MKSMFISERICTDLSFFIDYNIITIQNLVMFIKIIYYVPISTRIPLVKNPKIFKGSTTNLLLKRVRMLKERVYTVTS